jgi:hypothetical protein
VEGLDGDESLLVVPFPQRVGDFDRAAEDRLAVLGRGRVEQCVVHRNAVDLGLVVVEAGDHQFGVFDLARKREVPPRQRCRRLAGQ